MLVNQSNTNSTHPKSKRVTLRTSGVATRVKGKLPSPDLDRVLVCYVYLHMGVSQNEAAGTGSLSQGSVSRVCFVVCFGGLFRGSVSHSSSTSHS